MKRYELNGQEVELRCPTGFLTFQAQTLGLLESRLLREEFSP